MHPLFLLRPLVILALLLMAGCEETPTGRSHLALVPETFMAKMGEDAFDQLQRRQSVSKRRGYQPASSVRGT